MEVMAILKSSYDELSLKGDLRVLKWMMVLILTLQVAIVLNLI